MRLKIFKGLLICLGLLSGQVALALTFDWSPGVSVVGEMSMLQTKPGDSFESVAARYDVAYESLRQANVTVGPKAVSKGTLLIIPTQFILPKGPRNGIIVNLAEKRVYYFPPGENKVMTYPIAVGKEGWRTPLQSGTVIEKKLHPVWIVPDSIKAEQAASGQKVQHVVPAGPTNPLGDHALKLSIPKILLHGTRSPRSIGKRVSHGCMRLYPKDIEELFNAVNVGTPVLIVHQPIKVGVLDGKLLIEVHRPHKEYKQSFESMYEETQALVNAAKQNGQFTQNKKDLSTELKEAQSFPQEIGTEEFQTVAN